MRKTHVKAALERRVNEKLLRAAGLLCLDCLYSCVDRRCFPGWEASCRRTLIVDHLRVTYDRRASDPRGQGQTDWSPVPDRAG